MNFDHGCVTPESQAEFLKRYGHFLGVIENVKYYEYSNQGFRVITINGMIAQVDKIPVEYARIVMACKKIKFGGF